MKKFYTYAAGALLLAGLFVFAPSAAQAASWNDSAIGADCPVTMVAVASTPRNSIGCYPTSVSATPGSVVNAIIEYHNTGSDAARNVVVRLSPRTSPSSSTQTFSGTISASNTGTASGSGTISISAPAGATFGTVQWYPNQATSPSPLPGGQTGAELFTTGLNLGDVNGYSDCPISHSVINGFCHQGWLFVSYQLSTPVAPTPCTLGALTASPSSITSGATSSLNWTSSNCTSVTLTGPTGTVSTNLQGPVTVSPTATANYTLTGSGSTGAAAPQYTTVTVNTVVTPCTLGTLTATQTSIQPGASTTLNWNSSNCSNVTLSGPTGTVSTNLQGPVTVSPTVTTTYTLNGYGSTGASAPQSITIYVNTPLTCSISNFTASQYNVTSGGSTMLNWTTNGCTNVTVSGPTGTVSTNIQGPFTTPQLYNTTTYTINAYGAGSGNTATANPVTITVNAISAQCIVSNFTASQYNVTAGANATLNWNTTGCTSVTVSGPTGTVSTNLQGPYTTPSLYGTSTYSIIATGANGLAATATPVTITVNTVVAPTCILQSFYASPSQVVSGATTMLYWTTSGCTSVSVTGPGVNSYILSGSIPTAAIYGTNTYSIVASSTNTVNQSITVSTSQVVNTAPTVTTSGATNVSTGSATLNGYINVNNSNCYYSYYNYCNSNTYTTYYFQYGTSQYSLNSQTPTQTFTSTAGNVSAYLTNLQPNTTYFFQLYASNSAGSANGGVLSFVTTGAVSSGISAITSVATNVTSSSARLNGLVLGSQTTAPVTAYFEYGTSPSLGFQTSAQNVSTLNPVNTGDTIATTANTVYYYRIVALSNGQTYPGSTVSFTTSNGTVNPVVITRVVNTTGGGSSFVSLSITNQSVSVAPGDSINYLVTYQNISGSTLSNAVLNVILPTGVTFRQASQGVLTTNNTVAVTLGTLVPNAQGTVTIAATADATVIPGNNLVTTATLAFTTPAKAQDSAIAYVLNNVVARTSNNLAGLALFGGGFFPTTLLGWILLLGLILVLILIARYFYHRANAAQRAAAPVTHTYYAAPGAPQAPAQHGNQGGYQGNNLPH